MRSRQIAPQEAIRRSSRGQAPARKSLAWALCFLVVSGLYGCSIDRQSASVNPGVELRELKKYYVVKLGPDNRGVNRLIVAHLTNMGFTADTGPAESMPDDADVIVTYEDRWQWDITMYMIGLTIHFRNPKNQQLLAVGNSYHTSITRMPPTAMVGEVLGNIFAKSKKPS